MPKAERREPEFANGPSGSAKRPRLKTRGEATINAERITQSIRMRFNPLRGLTPERLSQYLDQFDIGFFRQAAITWDKIERRDYRIKVVAPKRKKAVARHGYDVQSIDKLDDSQRDLAEQQVKELKFFYDNLTATNAIRPDEEGGLNLLVRQMMDAHAKYYAVHEKVFVVKTAPDSSTQPSPQGGQTSSGPNAGPSGTGQETDGQAQLVTQMLTARFVFCPLWWFEGTTGKLRYMDSEFQVYGRDMDSDEWLVTVGEGIMEACSVAWMFKNLTLQDWVAYCEKFGTPFIDAATSAAPGSEDWEALKGYVQNFGPDGGGVRSDTATVNLIEPKGAAAATFQQMVENMDRALTILWRGGDLGTTSSKDATGASLQGDESDILEGDDAVLIEETLAMNVSRQVIEWYHGPDAPVLAFLKFRQEQDPDAVKFQRTVFTQFAADGTVVDVLANQVDLKKLVQDVGLPLNEEYVDPYLPVKDKSGAMVSGDLVKDGEDNIIGARTDQTASGPNAPGEADGKPGQIPAGKPSEIVNDELSDSGHEMYARAVAEDMQAVRERVAALAQITDDTILRQRSLELVAEIEKLKADILHLPKSAQALAETMVAGFFGGLTQDVPKTEVVNGDVPGHEFHGNQWTEAAAAEHQKLRSEADAAHFGAHQAEMSHASNADIQQANQAAYEKYKAAADHAKANGNPHMARVMRQKAQYHKQTSQYYATLKSKGANA